MVWQANVLTLHSSKTVLDLIDLWSKLESSLLYIGGLCDKWSVSHDDLRISDINDNIISYNKK